jgi:hypothetical protein
MGSIGFHYRHHDGVVSGSPSVFVSDCAGGIADSDKCDTSEFGAACVGISGEEIHKEVRRLVASVLDRMSRDPIGEQGGINLYGYVGNDPVNAIDPGGLATYYVTV